MNKKGPHLIDAQVESMAPAVIKMIQRQFGALIAIVRTRSCERGLRLFTL